MSATLQAVRSLIAAKKVRVSDHAYDELANDGLLAEEVMPRLNARIAKKPAAAVV